MSEWIGSDLGDLALFASVVDQGGFTAASLKTGIPQSTISRRVSALESRLGVRLLDRTTRRMRLTEAGRRTLDHARLMVDAGAAAMSSGDLLKSQPSGLLRVSAPVMLTHFLLPEAARSYMRRYPDVSVALEFTTRTLDPLEDDIDVAVRVGLPETSKSSVHKLFSAKLGVFVAPSFSGAISASPDGVTAHEIFGATRGPLTSDLIFRKGEAVVTAAITLRLRCNDIRTVINAAESCNGLALLPDFAAPPGWTQVWKDWSLPLIDVVAVTTPHFRNLPRVGAFIDILQNPVTFHPSDTGTDRSLSSHL